MPRILLSPRQSSFQYVEIFSPPQPVSISAIFPASGAGFQLPVDSPISVLPKAHPTGFLGAMRMESSSPRSHPHPSSILLPRWKNKTNLAFSWEGALDSAQDELTSNRLSESQIILGTIISACTGALISTQTSKSLLCGDVTKGNYWYLSQTVLSTVFHFHTLLLSIGRVLGWRDQPELLSLLSTQSLEHTHVFQKSVGGYLN